VPARKGGGGRSESAVRGEEAGDHCRWRSGEGGYRARGYAALGGERIRVLHDPAFRDLAKLGLPDPSQAGPRTLVCLGLLAGAALGGDLDGREVCGRGGGESRRRLLQGEAQGGGEETGPEGNERGREVNHGTGADPLLFR
jgi:hypothetical protein